MGQFRYCRPTTLETALEVIADASREAAVHCLAGGTALMLLARQGLLEPGLIVDLGSLTALESIEVMPDGTLRIGALVTLRELETDERVRALQPELARTMERVASLRIRTQATIGGNLSHADPAQDPPPVLIALDARVELASVRGRRTVSLEEFIVGPFETSLEADEVVAAVVVPPLSPRSSVRTTKFLPRTVDDYATVSVAVRLDRRPDGRIGGARIVVGAAGPRPLRIRIAEAELLDRHPAEVDLELVGRLVASAVEPVDDIRGSAEYKRAMAALWSRRTIESVVEAGRSDWEGQG